MKTVRFAVYTILDSDERCRPLSQEGIKSGCRDFSGGIVVKNLPFMAGDTDLIPSWGIKITCATGQLSLCSTAKIQDSQKIIIK